MSEKWGGDWIRTGVNVIVEIVEVEGVSVGRGM